MMWQLTVDTVDDVMTRQVVTATARTSFKDLVALMATHRVSGIPIVADGRPIGMVSEADTLAKQEYQGGARRPHWFSGRNRRAHFRKSTGLTAAEMMTAPAVTIRETEPVTSAARLLAEKKVRRLCVVDEHGTLVGIVSRRDIIATFLRDDEDIRADIEEHVFQRGMWAFPGTLTASVESGVAELAGTVDRRTTAQVAGQLTQSIPGVVGVRNTIQYEIDDTVSTAL